MGIVKPALILVRVVSAVGAFNQHSEQPEHDIIVRVSLMTGPGDAKNVEGHSGPGHFFQGWLYHVELQLGSGGFGPAVHYWAYYEGMHNGSAVREVGWTSSHSVCDNASFEEKLHQVLADFAIIP